MAIAWPVVNGSSEAQMSNVTNQRLAEVRQLCRLGYYYESIAPEFAKALGCYMAAAHVIVLRPDESGMPARAVIAGFLPTDEVLDFFSKPGLPQEILWRTLCGVTSLQLHTRAEYREFAATRHHSAPEVERIDSLLWQSILDGAGRRSIVALVRLASQEPFSAADQARLLALDGNLTSLFNSTGQGTDYEWDGEEGIFITDRNGKIEQLCPQARQLQQLVLQSIGIAGPTTESFWQEGLADLARRARPDYDGGPVLSPPVWTFGASHGRFELRAYPLNGGATCFGKLVIRARRYCPVEALLVQRLSVLHLSARQRDVALLLARGVPTPIVATDLKLRSSTVSAVVKDIYRRTGATSRTSLRELLIGDSHLCPSESKSATRRSLWRTSYVSKH